MKRDWDERYRTGDLPWDTGEVDFHLKRAIKAFEIKPCKVLELGCGTGTNAIWLCKRGFRVMAIDLSRAALEQAAHKIAKAKARVRLIEGDMLKTEIAGGPFGFVFDRGMFHSLNSRRDRMELARSIGAHLRTGGMWLSLIGSADGPELAVGPPRLSAQDIVSAVEPSFNIISLKATRLGTLRGTGPAAWECLMRRRG